MGQRVAEFRQVTKPVFPTAEIFLERVGELLAQIPVTFTKTNRFGVDVVAFGVLEFGFVHPDPREVIEAPKGIYDECLNDYGSRDHVVLVGNGFLLRWQDIEYEIDTADQRIKATTKALM